VLSGGVVALLLHNPASSVEAFGLEEMRQRSGVVFTSLGIRDGDPM